jgi:hypothetical protein
MHRGYPTAPPIARAHAPIQEAGAGRKVVSQPGSQSWWVRAFVVRPSADPPSGCLRCPPGLVAAGDDRRRALGRMVRPPPVNIDKQHSEKRVHHSSGRHVDPATPRHRTAPPRPSTRLIQSARSLKPPESGTGVGQRRRRAQQPIHGRDERQAITPTQQGTKVPTSTVTSARVSIGRRRDNVDDRSRVRQVRATEAGAGGNHHDRYTARRPGDARSQ